MTGTRMARIDEAKYQRYDGDPVSLRCARMT